jgi:DNA-binding transcriptional MerR regulator/methylmalonyl-CoA mutase cobalamin-binding subunit
MRMVIRRTGLSADVLRAWEKRYQAVSPDRSGGGQRLYSDDDLTRLTLLQQVTSNGRNISQVARLDADQLRALLVEDAAAALAVGNDRTAAKTPDLLDRLLDAAARLDGEELDRQLRRSTLQLGAAAAIERVIVPFLHEIGARWHRNELNPAHEHLASAVVQRNLHRLLEGGGVATDAPRIVVAALPGERHEIGLQVVAAVAAGEEWRVVYLGADLPIETIASATRQSEARVLAISVVSGNGKAPVVAGLTALRKALGRSVTIVVGGAAAPHYRAELDPLGILVLDDLAGLRSFLQTFRDRNG